MATATTEPGKQVSIYQQTRDELEGVHGEIAASLPQQLPVARFIRAAAWAVQAEPRLQQCSRRSIIAACLRAAHDGLLPDGREGALVAYEVKQGNDNRRAMVAQWMPMVAGIRKKVFNTGLLKNWQVQVVQEGDAFDYELGDRPFIKHKPSARGGRTRKVLFAYSIATFPDGTQSFEIMNQDQLADVQKKSRAQRGPWSDPIFFPEMCRKTVAKLHAKQLPTSSDIESIFRREDEAMAQLSAAADHEPPAPLPSSTRNALEQFAPHSDEPEPPTIDGDSPPTQPEPPTPEPPQAEPSAAAATDSELPLSGTPKEQPAADDKGTPKTAAEYKNYYERTRAAATGKTGAAMLRRWFYSSPQNELRARCGVDVKEYEADLKKHLERLEK